MKLPETIQSERGVSPVIGVILMVAITVILAAVIGSFVLGIGGNVEQTPQASLSVDANGSDITIAHEGGDSLDWDDINVTVAGSDASGYPESGSFDPGQSETFSHSTSDGDTIRVIHTPTGGMILQTEARV